MSVTLSVSTMQLSTISLEQALLMTLAYSDIFDYPLTLKETHRYLHGVSCTLEEARICLTSSNKIECKDGYYFLPGRRHIVTLRQSREEISRRAYERAMLYGRILGKLPFIRMVAMTGSLAVRNCDETGDYDYMLVTSVGRVWTARALALLLNRFARLFGHTLCPNLIVSERSLEWPEQSLYLAREIHQMVLIVGEEVYRRVLESNQWTKNYLPNSGSDVSQVCMTSKIWKGFEHSPFIDRIEAWEMNRKIARFTRQAGFGVETVFSEDVCQGNFDHHAKWTGERYENRLRELGLETSSTMERHQ